MLSHVRSDESLQVLLFIVLPLLLLLVAGVFLRIRYTPPSTAKFPKFSGELFQGGQRGLLHRLPGQ